MDFTCRAIALFAFTTVLLGCTQQPQKNSVATVEAGANYLQKQCVSCHKLTGTPSVAPTMAEIQAAYLAAYPEEPAFVNAFVAFLNAPTHNTALLPKAVAQYGLMPAMGYLPNDLRDLAKYLYKQKLATTEPLPKDSLQANLLAYAAAVKQALGKNLMQALATGGPVHAVDFCNVRAMPLTDSIAQLYGVQIKRVTNKPRNPNNAASAFEQTVLEILSNRLANSQSTDPIFTSHKVGMRAYVPIVTNALCLNCHGTPEKDISLPTLAAIKAKYPGDAAFGYAENQLRGMFVVQ